MSDPIPPTNPNRLDDVFVQSRRELVSILLIWLVFAGWVIAASAFLAYEDTSEGVELVFGMPAWVFWAIGLPWLGANGVIFWFCLGFMKDQSLESEET